MRKIIKASQTGLTRIFARFGRTNGRKSTSPELYWYEYEASSRGL